MCKIVCYNSNRLIVLPCLFLTNCKISAPKDGNGAQKNIHIFRSNAPTFLKLGVRFYHMHTKGWIFFRSRCVMSSWSKTTFKSFVTKDDLMQQPLWFWNWDYVLVIRHISRNQLLLIFVPPRVQR